MTHAGTYLKLLGASAAGGTVLELSPELFDLFWDLSIRAELTLPEFQQYLADGLMTQVTGPVLVTNPASAVGAGWAIGTTLGGWWFSR